jgi:hypothetical protein
LKRWAARAKVCLEAGKTASKHKTTTEIQRQTAQNQPKTFTEKQKVSKQRLFPQPVKPASIGAFDVRAEVHTLHPKM